MLAIGLIPTMLARGKPAFLTSILSGSILFSFGFVFYSLSLWASASTATIQAVFWFILAYQKLSRKKIGKSANDGIPPRRRLKRSVRTVKSE
jgi:hypothetical protein